MYENQSSYLLFEIYGSKIYHMHLSNGHVSIRTKTTRKEIIALCKIVPKIFLVVLFIPSSACHTFLICFCRSKILFYTRWKSTRMVWFNIAFYYISYWQINSTQQLSCEKHEIEVKYYEHKVIFLPTYVLSVHRKILLDTYVLK